MPTIPTFHRDMVRARERWLDEAEGDEKRERRQQSDFLAKKDSDGWVVDLHAMRTTLGFRSSFFTLPQDYETSN